MEFFDNFLRSAWPSIVTIAGGWPIIWFLTEFVARPIRRFFDMKMEAKRLTLLLWNAPQYGQQGPEEWRTEMAELKGTRTSLSELGEALFAFSQSE